MHTPALFGPRDVPMPSNYVMAKYHLSRTTLWRWRRAGLPSQCVGGKLFVKEADVITFIEAQSVNAKGIKP